MSINPSDILGVVGKLTKEWTKQRKAEDRRSRSSDSRAYIYSDRVNFTDVADEIPPGAYQIASGNDRYTVSKRHLYYAVREQFKAKTSRELRLKYFAGTLL